MTWEIGFVVVVVAVAMGLLASNRVRVDLVALTIPVALLAGGIVTAEEAVSGFAHPATVTVAAMLVLSLGLVKTGAVGTIARWARTAPLGGPTRRLLALSLTAAGVSPFLNNTAVVVVFLPVFLALAESADEPPSRYLIPLSYAAILGGTVTLIGTSTNLIVDGMAQARGYTELSLFSIAPLGLVYLGVGSAYLFTIGRRLLPRRMGEIDLSGKYAIREFIGELKVQPTTPSVGVRIADTGWRESLGVSVVGLRRGERAVWGPLGNRLLRVGDVLFVQGPPDRLVRLAQREELATPAHMVDIAQRMDQAAARLAEVLVTPTAPLAGRTLAETRFLQLHQVAVLAILHHGRTLRDRLAHERIEPGDVLLVHGEALALAQLAQAPGYVLLGEIERAAIDRPRALVALAILLGVVALAGLGLVAILPAALAGVIAMIVTRCVRLDELYAEMEWSVVFLLAGVLPLGIAMDSTGAADRIGELVGGLVGPLGVTATVLAFYLVTSLLTEVMSNNAAAVVLTPIAIRTAVDLDLNPYALLVAVMFGASASFMTPVGYQTNALVLGPGGYRFSDYIRVGAPLNLLLAVVAALLIPVLWPS